MESKPGYVLLIIAGVLNALLTIATLLIGQLILIVLLPALFLLGLSEFINNLTYFISFIFLLITILTFYCAKWVRDPKTTFRGGLVALILGIITFNIFSLVGGIVAMIHGKE